MVKAPQPFLIWICHNRVKIVPTIQTGEILRKQRMYWAGKRLKINPPRHKQSSKDFRWLEEVGSKNTLGSCTRRSPLSSSVVHPSAQRRLITLAASARRSQLSLSPSRGWAGWCEILTIHRGASIPSFGLLPPPPGTKQDSPTSPKTRSNIFQEESWEKLKQITARMALLFSSGVDLVIWRSKSTKRWSKGGSDRNIYHWMTAKMSQFMEKNQRRGEASAVRFSHYCLLRRTSHVYFVFLRFYF